MTEFWFGDAFAQRDRRHRKITFVQLFAALPDREELGYYRDSDQTRYCAKFRSRFDTPECVLVFADAVRRLRLFTGTRMVLKRRGFKEDVAQIANASSEECLRSLGSLDLQCRNLRNANAEALA